MATHGAAITTATASSPVPTFSKAFPTTLSASKAAGIAAIRISQVNGDILLEELNAKQEAMIGLRLHALVNSEKKITAIAVTQMGSGPDPLPLTTAQRSALVLIDNELKEFKTLNTVKPPAPTQGHGVYELSLWGDFKAVLLGAAVGIDCAAAALEGGLNPFADAGCVAAATLAEMEVQGSDDSSSTASKDDNSSSTGTGSGSHGSGGGTGGAITPGSQGGGISTVPVGGGSGPRIPDGTVQVIEQN